MIGNLLLACGLALGVGFNLRAPKTPITSSLTPYTLPHYNKEVGVTWFREGSFDFGRTYAGNSDSTWYYYYYNNGAYTGSFIRSNPYDYDSVYNYLLGGTGDLFLIANLRSSYSGDYGILEFYIAYSGKLYNGKYNLFNYFNYYTTNNTTFEGGGCSLVMPHDGSVRPDFDLTGGETTNIYGVLYNTMPTNDNYAPMFTYPYYFKFFTTAAQTTLYFNIYNFVDINDNFNEIFGDYNDGYTIGYSTGYNSGYNEGQSTGYHNGYIDGQNAGMQISQTSFMSLFASLVDTPMRMLYSLFNFDLFGTSMLIIILSTLTAIIVIKILKKFI